jgi:hypothetical protein
VTTSQIIACTTAWTGALVACLPLIAHWRATRRTHTIPYTPPPREHCGHLTPDTGLTTPRTECVLHPGHQGSHADEAGCRWRLTPVTRTDGVVCEAYRLPTTSEDSGLCAGCGMSDYKHEEPRHA